MGTCSASLTNGPSIDTYEQKSTIPIPVNGSEDPKKQYYECFFCKFDFLQEALFCVSISSEKGWAYCNDCFNSGTVKHNILAWINKNKIIPCLWLFDSNEFKKSIYSTTTATATATATGSVDQTKK